MPFHRCLRAMMLLAATGTTGAQTSGPEQWHSLQRGADGYIEVRSTVMISDTCYTAGYAESSAPASQTGREDAVTVTLTLLHGGAYACVKVPRPVYFRARVPVPEGAATLAIFVTDPRTGNISRRELPLPRE